ncbi:hypothetical protein M422DRAFT_112551, partial [Sphaerobolus stellatus SS14]
DTGSTLSDYNIQRESALYLVICFYGSMQISDQTLTGKTITLKMLQTFQLSDLNAPCNSDFILPDQQHLIFASKQLKD